MPGGKAAACLLKTYYVFGSHANYNVLKQTRYPHVLDVNNRRRLIIHAWPVFRLE